MSQLWQRKESQWQQLNRAILSAAKSACHYVTYCSPPFFCRYDQKCLYFGGYFLTCISNIYTPPIVQWCERQIKVVVLVAEVCQIRQVTKAVTEKLQVLKTFLTLWHHPSPDGAMLLGACCSIKWHVDMHRVSWHICLSVCLSVCLSCNRHALYLLPIECSSLKFHEMKSFFFLMMNDLTEMST